jgi:hypothetical protein
MSWKEKEREAFRDEIKKWPQMDALGSVDYWLERWEMREKELYALLPVIEVKRNLKDGYWNMKYSVGEDYVETIHLSEDLSDTDKLQTVLKVVQSANEAYKQMTILARGE